MSKLNDRIHLLYIINHSLCTIEVSLSISNYGLLIYIFGNITSDQVNYRTLSDSGNILPK